MAGNGGPVSLRTATIRVLVAALADSSLFVREAATSALQENAKRNAAVVLDCCTASLRVGKRRGGQLGSHHAGVLSIMAYTIQAMDEEEMDNVFIQKMAKVALGEMTTNKDMNSEWQQAASSLLVALGSRLPDMMMDEVFLQLAGSTVPMFAVVPTLAEFASTDALQFAPRLKGVLSRVLPVLGGIKDSQRQTFANAFTCWCEAISYYNEATASNSLLDGDTLALLYSVFDLFLGSWIMSRDPKVRLATAEALGQMVVFISRPQLKSALPRLLPSILGSYRKQKENLLPITRSLHMILNTVLVTGIAPMIDYVGLIPVVNSILPMASLSYKKARRSDLSSFLKNFNEVMHCFVTIGVVYPDDTFADLIMRTGSREDSIRLGALSVLKHLVTRLSEKWVAKKSILADAVKSALQDHDLNSRKATAELIVSMAANGYLEVDNNEIFMEFLVRQCAIADVEVEQFKTEQASMERAIQAIGMQLPNKNELKVGAVSPGELRAVCEKSLLLLASTMPEVEYFLWPFLLKMVIPVKYSGAVATVCKCISEICRRKMMGGDVISVDYATHADIPRPEDVLARLLVLLQNPSAREQQAPRLLMVLFYLAPLFPKAVTLLWEDEVPKLKAFIADSDDLRESSWQQETWDNMIIHLLSESIDVIQSSTWTISLGNAFTSHYDLYIGDHEHSALLHRCLGMLLQKVDDRDFVRKKIAVMYKRADVGNETNRLGLAMGMGLVAASHLDTVLEKLQNVLENQGKNRFRRFLAVLFDQRHAPDVDDVCAALALMYGYAASYAPSAAIEARIETLVGSNMLSGLLSVRTPAAKQAVITGIDLLGQAVIKAGENGAPFLLKKRDQILEYIMALMAGQAAGYILGIPSLLDSEQFLHTQELALNACRTLVSVEPKLPMVTRDHILQATLGFFTLPSEPATIINSLISNLIVLLCAILLTSGEDGKSRADQLQYLLKNLDQYASSPIELQRQRACSAVLAILRQFRALCTAGTCPVNCSGHCMHLRSTGDRGQNSSSAILLLPTREQLHLGERTMAYLPRCADLSPEIRKTSAQILDLLFSIALLLPKLVGSTATEDRQPSYAALSALEELIAVTNWEASHDQVDVMRRIVAAVGGFLTTDELVVALRGCRRAICDKVSQSAQGSIVAVAQFIQSRGNELQQNDISRITQALLSAGTAAGDRMLRQQVLASVCCLAEHSQANLVFEELLIAAEKDGSRKDNSRQRGAWPIQEAFMAVAEHELLAHPFLELVLGILNKSPDYEADDTDKDIQQMTFAGTLNPLPHAATLALGALFRGTAGRKAVEKDYPAVLCALFLHIGCCHGTSGPDIQPLRDLVGTFQVFCESVGDEEMGKVLATDGELRLSGERWIEAVGEIASCSARARPEEVNSICALLWPALKRPYDFQRAAAAAALSEYVHYSEGDVLLSHLVGALSAHIGDESPTVRRLCVQGLVQVPRKELAKYASQVLSVIVALIEDNEEDVALTAVHGLSLVLEVVPEETVNPVLLSLCVRLRALQSQQNVSMRAAAFTALGALSKFGEGSQQEALLEQIHACLPRLVFHVNDEASAVRYACKSTLRKVAPLLGAQEIFSLMNSRAFDSDRRLDYDDFLREFTKYLVMELGDRIDSYITSAIQAFDSPWPLIQANAAYFSGCLLSRLSDRKPLALYLPQVSGALVRMTANAPSAVVRTKSAAALSLLLNEIQKLTL